MIRNQIWLGQPARKKNSFSWLWLSLSVIVLDQFIKSMIIAHFEYNEPFFILPYFNILLEHNTGAAFSFLSSLGTLATYFFVIMALVISVILLIWMYRLPRKNYWLGISLALILGGAIGNLWDRIQYGYVIDFLHLHVGAWSWPVFNIADVAITLGAFMLIIDLFRKS